MCGPMRAIISLATRWSSTRRAGADLETKLQSRPPGEGLSFNLCTVEAYQCLGRWHREVAVQDRREQQGSLGML